MDGATKSLELVIVKRVDMDEIASINVPDSRTDRAVQNDVSAVDIDHGVVTKSLDIAFAIRALQAKLATPDAQQVH